MGEFPEPIAVVGTACRFPGHATSPSKLWDLIRDPRDVLSRIPDDRFNPEGFYHQDGKYHGHANVQESYLLEGAVTRHFDAKFFGISTTEANTIDPQLRLLLEMVYEALEGSGHTIEQLKGSDTAVYTGQMLDDYDHIMTRDEEYIGTYHLLGTQRTMMANRISYFFDWHGPSMNLDTACSSSLVAVHQAVQQLRSTQSRVAVAAGTNLILNPQNFITSSKLKMLSPESRSRMWDAEANGYARGDGVAAVVLKSLSNAIADGDDIECIIRETGVNQDGKTQGISQPSSRAQASLIRACYSRIGLDPSQPEHRPQYFEAHGTGTPAGMKELVDIWDILLTDPGDPVEAEAISAAFFPQGDTNLDDTDKLKVGSIKTVIGHTEGTAGLASLMKASLALQNAVIPPNLHFHRLNPQVAPFYHSLSVPTALNPWPATTGPRRASVNSFGFGGTNAHAILESHPLTEEATTNASQQVFMPFVFSANSQKSLDTYLESFAAFLEGAPPALNLRNLAYTLCCRRTRFDVTAHFPPSDKDQLANRIRQHLVSTKSEPEGPMPARKPTNAVESPRILGIFTGQGAQWARQAVELVESSPTCRETLEKLDRRLDALPDKPTWSLVGELAKDAATSRIGEAELSQPLCTAIQILQVDLLQAAGITLSAVVGHSSGEMGAAYASGIVTAEEAICIAYYRGKWSSLAGGVNGKEGAMLAVEATSDDIVSLCESSQYKGRVGVAAINSPTSATVSGDKDAVEEMRVQIQSEGKFARLLRVNKAYHSHHMLPCAEPYLRSLQAVGITPKASAGPRWFSSVLGKEMFDVSSLKAEYWNTNATQPVLFRQALESACQAGGVFDMAIEIGPHSALKTPALATMAGHTSADIPYTSLIQRNTHAVGSVAEFLAACWTRLGNRAVDMEAYDQYMQPDGVTRAKLLKNLPSYAWQHDQEYWHESRHAWTTRTRSTPVHPLLGHATPDSTSQEMRWRHMLKISEIPWLNGHKLQGQIVFPAAGYIVLCLEASLVLCGGEASAKLIEVTDIEFEKALAFDHEEQSVETILSLTDIVRGTEGEVTAKFRCIAAAAEKVGAQLDLRAYGKVRIVTGSSDASVLPPRSEIVSGMHNVSRDVFYDSLQKLEYGYSSPFSALSSLQRRLGASTGRIENLEATNLMIHPAILDAAFQSLFVAHSEPYDGEIWSLHAPRSIKSISVNPQLCKMEAGKGGGLLFDCHQPEEPDGIVGDIAVYSSDALYTLVQVEELRCVPLGSGMAEQDSELFSSMVWGVAEPGAHLVSQNQEVPPDQKNLAQVLERLGVYCLRQLEETVSKTHHSRISGPHVRLYKFAQHILSQLEQGKQSRLCPEWLSDTAQDVAAALEPWEHTIDVRLLRAVGMELPQIATGKSKAIEVAMQDNMLSKYYEDSLGFGRFTEYLAKTVKQITHRYPRLDILEIGAGTGGATKGIFHEIGDSFGSYTYTDVSSGFFGSPKETFSEQADRMTFKILDAGKDPVAQGFTEGSYDVVVASMVLHATPSLEATLTNTRRLLKPGGYLVAFEGHETEIARLGASFGAFDGWWVGAETDGRHLSPFMSRGDWHALLQRTGFSGCDTTTTEDDALVHPYFVFTAQAVDNGISLLREPRSLLGRDSFAKCELLLLGGQTTTSQHLMRRIGAALESFFGTIVVASDLDQVSSPLTSRTLVLSLLDLDAVYLNKVNEQTLEQVKRLLINPAHIFWVQSEQSPHREYAHMVLGLFRSLAREMCGFEYQHLTVNKDVSLCEDIIVDCFLQTHAARLLRLQEPSRSMLHTIEPEVAIDQYDNVIVPRLMSNDRMNGRYNSSRRQVTSTVSIEQNTVEIGVEHGCIYLHRQLEEASSQSSNERHLRVLYSFISALRLTKMDFLYLVYGVDLESGEGFIALSPTNASTISTNQGLCARVQIRQQDAPFLLAEVASRIVASAVLEGLSRNDLILVHEPEPSLAAILETSARDSGVRVVFSTTQNSGTARARWLKIHPKTSIRALQRQLPRQVSLLVDLTPSDSCSGGPQIISALPSQTRYESLDTLFSQDAREFVRSHFEDVSHRFQQAALGAKDPTATGSQTGPDPSILVARVSLGCNTWPEPTMLSIADLPNHELPVHPTSIVDWPTESRVPVKVQPISSQILFPDSKTYWLVGLSSSLGLSLCEWMVHHGARYIVLSSRAPQVDQQWLDKMATNGAAISVAACNVNNKNSMQQVYSEISSTLPPLGGVAQGAMVLDDMSFESMTADAWNRVVKPKVDGTKLLDEMLQDVDLDFFVCFSSVLSVIGALGQSNYAAANLYMSALMETRRQRGLAGSLINIGVILGVGYLSRTETDWKSLVTSGSLRCMSERDFHQLFAEAVVAGRPGSQAAREITAGIAKYDAQGELQPAWAGNPIMSHHVLTKSARVTSTVGEGSVAPIPVRLKQATTKAEVQDIVRASFLSKIHALYQMSPETLAEQSPEDMHLDAMGTDSLLAVEIRGWFMQTLQVNIPVLKILSGASVEDLVLEASDNLPTDLIPQFEPAPTRDETSPAPSSKALSSPSSVFSSADTDHNTAQLDEMEASLASLDPAGSPKHHPQVTREGPLSFSQSTFWFVSALLQDPTGLNHTGVFRMTGKVRRQDMEKALDAVSDRHEALRTCFVEEGCTTKQAVLESHTVSLEYRDISIESQVDDVVSELQAHSYEMSRGHNFRLMLIALSEDVHFLVFGTHSLMMDGLSLQVLLKDLQACYQGLVPTTNCRQYLDHAIKQREQYMTGHFEPQLDYWRQELDALPSPMPLLSLSKATQRPAMAEYANWYTYFKVNAATSDLVQRICREHRVTPFHFYLTVFRVLLMRLTGSEDVAIGIADANRGEDDLMSSIGPYLNLLPLRLQTRETDAFGSILKHTRTKAYEALANSAVPFQVLLDQLHTERSASFTPIFQSFVDYRQGQRIKQSWADCELELLSIHNSRVGYDVSLDIIDDLEGECAISLITRKDLFTQQDTDRLSECYQHLAEAFAKDATSTVASVELFSPVEIEETMEWARGESFASYWPSSSALRVREVAQLYPTSCAVREGERALTYAELMHRAGMIAERLRDNKVQAGDRVAVAQQSTPTWISSMLAVWSVGASYVPLDPTAPLSRLVDIVQDSDSVLVLVDKKRSGLFQGMETLSILNADDNGVRSQGAPEIAQLSSNAEAVLLYTSGSTGKPKGVSLSHRNILNCIEAVPHRVTMGRELVLQQSSVGFDMSIFQVFMALCHGGVVHLVPDHLRGDAEAICDMIVSQGITFTCACPSEYRTWLRYGNTDQLASSAWSKAVSGGEAVEGMLLKQFADLDKKDLALYNLYGPTETSFAASATEVSYQENITDGEEGKPTAGRPLGNYKMYILDETLHALPAGVRGEVYIGGTGVAKEYINKPGLSAERFLDDPLASQEDINKGWTKLHKTGDLARWSRDGSIVLEGRVAEDTQEKIRGQRLDLAEVERALVEGTGGAVMEAGAAIQRPPDGNERLVAFVVLASGVRDREAQLLSELGHRDFGLPRYMRPSAIVPVDRLPLSDSAKLDRKALARLPLPAAARSEDLPEQLSEAERQLGDIWEQILGCAGGVSNGDITPTSDFFNAGGTSLSLLELRQKIRATFGVELSLTDMFQASTLSAMALLVSQDTSPGPHTSGPIDWESETSLPLDILNARPVPVSQRNGSRKNIVLTGATGYLGRALLDSLVKDDRIGTVHCIAVRQASSRSELAGMPKVLLYDGDLAAPSLGLSTSEVKAVFGNADLILHNGADVSFMKTYASLRVPNVEATKELVRMSLPQMIPFHYISTGATCSFAAVADGHTEVPPVSVAEHSPPQGKSLGYTSSKWASEVFMEKVNAKFPSWSVTIHRPSWIERSGKPDLDFTQNLRYYCEQLKAVPMFQTSSGGAVNVVTLEAVVDGVTSAIDETFGGHRKLSFVHHISDVNLAFNEKKSWIPHGQDENEYQTMDATEWAEVAVEHGMHSALKAFLDQLSKSHGYDRFAKLVN